MKFFFRVWVTMLAACFLTSMAAAQQSGLGSLLSQEMQQEQWVVTGRVVTLEESPVGGALVSIEPFAPVEQRSFRTDRNGEFRTVYVVTTEAAETLKVLVAVKKKGFLPAREIMDWGGGNTSLMLHITLRPEIEDPNLLSQEDLVSNLGPKLKALGPADGLLPKSAKDYARGAKEFLDRNRPDRSLQYFSKVAERSTACSKCLTMLALAELDSGDWDGALRDVNKAVTLARKDPGMKNPEGLVMFGVMESWSHDSKKAADLFAEALRAEPDSPLALQELGRVQVHNEDLTSADASLSKAIAAGAGLEAHLLRVEALLGEHHLDEAAAEMTRYQGDRKAKDMPFRARRVLDNVRAQIKLRAEYADTVAKVIEKPPEKLERSDPDLAGLEPAKSQEPLAPILDAVGKNVQAFFEGFQNTSSLEEIHEEKFGQHGKLRGVLDQKFHYVCLTTGGNLSGSIQEYRENVRTGLRQVQGLKNGFMLTAGFASASLIFLPAFQSESTFHYLGRQKLDDTETYVVAFAQLPLKTHLEGTFIHGTTSATTFTRGVAWIDAKNDQIVRLRTDLLKPLPELALKRETTRIVYQEVHFKSSSQGFWLPRQVAVTVEWNGKILHNEHRYSDFKWFGVTTKQKIGKPKVASAESGGD
jgi:tetratricopeptide (TPR) repeat protein